MDSILNLLLGYKKPPDSRPNLNYGKRTLNLARSPLFTIPFAIFVFLMLVAIFILGINNPVSFYEAAHHTPPPYEWMNDR